MDPRRSLVAGLIWLVVALATSFAFAASWWVGRVAREIVVQQHLRRLVLETDLLGSDLSQAVDARLAAVRAATGPRPSVGAGAARRGAYQVLAVRGSRSPPPFYRCNLHRRPPLKGAQASRRTRIWLCTTWARSWRIGMPRPASFHLAGAPRPFGGWPIGSSSNANPRFCTMDARVRSKKPSYGMMGKQRWRALGSPF